MGKKPSQHPKTKYVHKTAVPSNDVQRKKPYDYSAFKKRHTRTALFASIFLGGLLLFSVFKNIAYPLFWADESATAIGAERVLHYGYPKVHDGKNVFYDLRHSDGKLGIDERTDAYVGGSGWGQFYYGTIGYTLSRLANDFYVQTGIYRATFAIAGLAGLFFLLWFISRFFKDRFTQFSFTALFILIELNAISFVLVIKQVRYYSLSLLLVSLIMGTYCLSRFYKPIKNILFIPLLCLLLWLLFITFSPCYFIVLLTLGLSEGIVAVEKYVRADIKSAFKAIVPTGVSLLISLLSILPLLQYFRTFEIAKAMADFNGYNSRMYWYNLTTVAGYFMKFDLLWLALVLKIVTLPNSKSLLRFNGALFRLSQFFSLFFVAYVLLIARIPNFAFTRYFIPVQPFFTAVVVIDLFLLVSLFSLRSLELLSLKMMLTFTVFALFIAISFIRNLDDIKGHIAEMSEPYKGPIDYAVFDIKEHYKKTDNLVIATNYEETSFMYYLKSKVIVGYVGNNLAADSVLIPDVIMYRPWGNFPDIFENFKQKASYRVKRLAVKDQLCNDNPELNFLGDLPINHQYITVLPESALDSTELFYRKADRAN